MVVANPCSTPESPETSISYPAPGNTSKMGMEDEGVDESRKQRREKKEKYVQVQSVRGRKRKRKEIMQCRGCGNRIKGRQNDRKGEGGGGRKKEQQKNSKSDGKKEIKNTGTDMINGGGETLKENACREGQREANRYPIYSMDTHTHNMSSYNTQIPHQVKVK